MTEKPCAVCGKPFQAKRPAAKYCGETCRKRAQRSPAAPKGADGGPPDHPQPDGGEVPVNIVASTLTELVKAGRENSPAGQAAILLAYRLERSQGDTGGSVAAMVKQLSATLAEALKAAEKASVVDELKKRRDAKRAG